jgi:hypothetical protein
MRTPAHLAPPGVTGSGDHPVLWAEAGTDTRRAIVEPNLRERFDRAVRDDAGADPGEMAYAAMARAAASAAVGGNWRQPAWPPP